MTIGSKSKSDNSHTCDGAKTRTVFIGGLAKYSNYVALATFNKHFGKYKEMVVSVIMKDKLTGWRGFGFTTYADPSVVDKVIEDFHIINGKQAKGQSKDFRTKEIFVGEITSTVNEGYDKQPHDELLVESACIGLPRLHQMQYSYVPLNHHLRSPRARAPLRRLRHPAPPSPPTSEPPVLRIPSPLSVLAIAWIGLVNVNFPLLFRAFRRSETLSVAIISQPKVVLHSYRMKEIYIIDHRMPNGFLGPVKSEKLSVYRICWAVATVTVIETHLKQNYSIDVRLSIQELVNHARTNVNGAGNVQYAMEYIMKYGIAIVDNEDDCFHSVPPNILPIPEKLPGRRIYPLSSAKGYILIYKEEDIKQALERAPVTGKMWMPNDYQYNDWDIHEILPAGENMNHEVVLAGFGYEGEKDFFHYQNNYGVNWGNEGYGRLKCGATVAVLPILRPFTELYKPMGNPETHIEPKFFPTLLKLCSSSKAPFQLADIYFQLVENTESIEEQQVKDVPENQQHSLEPSQGECGHYANPDPSAEQDMGSQLLGPARWPSLNGTPSSHASMKIGDGFAAIGKQVAAVSGLTIDGGVGVTTVRRAVSANALKALIKFLTLAQPLGKSLLLRLLLNLCAHSVSRGILVHLFLEMIKPEVEGSACESAAINVHRLYGCHSNVVYGCLQLMDGLPALVLQRILEILAFLANKKSTAANMLFFFDQSVISQALRATTMDNKKDKGKEKIERGNTKDGDIPLILFFRLINRPLFFHRTSLLEQIMGLPQVMVLYEATKLESQSNLDKETQNAAVLEPKSDQEDKANGAESSSLDGKRDVEYTISLQLPQCDLHNRCSLGCEGFVDKVYRLAGDVLKKLALVVVSHRKFFAVELSELACSSSSSAVSELVHNTRMLGLNACSMAWAATLLVLQALSSLTMPSGGDNSSVEGVGEQEEHATMWKLNVANIGVGEQIQGPSSSSPLPPGTQRLFPFIKVANALFDEQLLDIYFTRLFYKHILGVKVTRHDIRAVNPDYYKNLKWMLENDVSDILDLTFSMDADEEIHLLYEKNQVTDYELKPGGRNMRVTDETKHEYIDLVADHILITAIHPQISSYLEGLNELAPRKLISIFNDKELELLISGLPESDMEDLTADTEYTGYVAASSVIQWLWKVVKGFN